jgi:hypothetical protein
MRAQERFGVAYKIANDEIVRRSATGGKIETPLFIGIGLLFVTPLRGARSDSQPVSQRVVIPCNEFVKFPNRACKEQQIFLNNNASVVVFCQMYSLDT